MTAITVPSVATIIRALDAAQAETRLDELADILVDAVAHGASVNFMAGFPQPQAREFWRGQLPGLADGTKCLLVAEAGARLLGTVVLSFAHQPNAPHRAEIGKMLVHSAARRQGLGRRLLTAAEQAACAAGRTLLLLDTETGSAGDRLYRSCGWTEIGRVPNHAFKPDGSLAETTIFCKELGAHRFSDRTPGLPHRAAAAAESAAAPGRTTPPSPAGCR
ncbi:GNAT family N-acetyltransferase [Rhodovastum atsumiense]|uniref:GNAT family N-acetyltransferase n=1 Tax=Rhodovastum atsumiense TaxID=504468 RepID=A0A5M6INA3_9PROT|nr:GNAT family N-acetyltransferase [Rhodovastum atsumiense]KAA5609741.1 GNAT family N-acetyltransferase [Rhodovastum atsumiense]CAH2604513.1 GNAT family N-acetyltransferase [Rhodovastum atsumiense]